jgi:ribosomal-protein-alanine N-acetyltransferase
MYPVGVSRHQLAADDISDVVALQQAVMPNPWSEQSFHSSLASSNGCYKLVKVGKPVAVAVVSQVLDEADLLTIAVAPSFQGNGLGGIFLADLMNVLKRQGARQCMLEVMVGNEPAIATYLRAGFKQIAIRTDYYCTENGKVDALVMRLNY